MSDQLISSIDEHVVLLDNDGFAIGTALKADVHHTNTPLHLAFSCYLVDSGGNVLLSQRAATKKTWPGVWTNSCCGHPALHEPVMDAIRRRLSDELGLIAGSIDVILPRFRYRVAMDNGIVENEICPVFRATALDDVQPELNPNEVANACWIPWPEVVKRAEDESHNLSPWCSLQVAELTSLGDDPRQWPTANFADLPPAVQTSHSK